MRKAAGGVSRLAAAVNRLSVWGLCSPITTATASVGAKVRKAIMCALPVVGVCYS